MSQSNPTTDPMPSQDSDDYEIETMKKKLKEMEEEAERFKQMQSQDTKDRSTESVEGREEIDSRSVYVGNVDYSATPEELQKHFQSCGIINRITILCDKFTGHPKGFAYVEFGDADNVNNAIALNESIFKGRPLKVTAKRTNIPAFARGRGRGSRGRGGAFRGRGRGRGSYAPY